MPNLNIYLYKKVKGTLEDGSVYSGNVYQGVDDDLYISHGESEVSLNDCVKLEICDD